MFYPASAARPKIKALIVEVSAPASFSWSAQKTFSYFEKVERELITLELLPEENEH